MYCPTLHGNGIAIAPRSPRVFVYLRRSISPQSFLPFPHVVETIQIDFVFEKTGSHLFDPIGSRTNALLSL
jgi:hypothetical protein